MLEDIAILTGGTVIASDLGYELKEVTVDMLGTAATVKVDKENTVIVSGAGSKERRKGKNQQHQIPDRRDHFRL